MLSIEKEKLVIDLYYNQRKNVRQIAQEARISFRDITAILKKKEAAAVNDDGSGNGMDNQQHNNGNDNNHPHSNEKSTQAYTLFSEEKKPVEVAVRLSLSEKEVTRYYTEYWRLKGLYELHFIYKELKGDLSPILKLYKLLKREGIINMDLEFFVHTVNTGMYKIPEIQKQYAKVKDDLELIDYKKTMAKYQLDDMNNQITYLNKISYSKRNDIAYLQIGAQELEGYVHGLENHNQLQQEV
jgi:uncharacterized beta-barrel protein YwiB (DUF1934 family)